MIFERTRQPNRSVRGPEPVTSRSSKTLLVLSLLAVSAPCVERVVAQEPSRCVECHEKTTAELHRQHAGSVHASIGCVACHGGAATARLKDVAHDVSKGFRTAASPAEISSQCVECHADVSRVGPYGLETAVAARWSRSKHGKLTGDRHVAGCTSCHGTHDVRSHRDPESSTHPTRVPGMCAKCHSDPRVMGLSKLPTDQHVEYLAGAHGRLFTSGLASSELAPTCVDCHSAHGAKPPDEQGVPAVCRKCHFEEHRYMTSGMHFKSLRQTGSPSCVDCHDNHHTTLPASIEVTCKSCHDGGDDPVRAVVSRLDELLKRAASKMRQLDDRVVRAPGELSETSRRLIEAERDRIGELYSHARQVSHSLRMEDLELAIARMEESVKTVSAISSAHLDEDHGFGTPLVATILIGVVGFLIALTIVFARLLVRLSRSGNAAPRLRSGGRA